MSNDQQMEEILRRLDKAERDARFARDWVEIANLHGRYNHLVLGHYWDKIIDEMFAKKTPGVKAEIVESGVFHGIEGVRRVFRDMLGKLYNYEGNLALHELTTPVIEIAKDGNTARGMWYTWGPNTFHDPEKGTKAIWQVIKYNHVFVKEDGKWKFLDFRGYLMFRSSFDKGWVNEPVIQGSTIKGPDESAAIQSDEPTSFHCPYDPSRNWGAEVPLPPEPEE
ncbi:MAG: nuclear transport factor 2 family protein [Desulfobacteraceae bacterium]|nr:nuclear transport factor 2 family protein [Desulfobacteraceae bacterium]